MRFIKLEKLINIFEGYQKCFKVEGYSLLLIHQNNKNYLYLNQCPHQKKPLGNNCLKGDSIRCPWHGIEYDIQSGHSKPSSHLNSSLNINLALTQYPLAYEENYVGFYLK